MTFLAFFVSLPFCLYAQQSNQKKLANEEGGEDPFSYVVTNPTSDAETFETIEIQFPNAAKASFIPDYFDRFDFYEVKKDGKTYPINDLGTVYCQKNKIVFDFGGKTLSVDNRWEIIMQPGLFELLDDEKNVLGTNELMSIVAVQGKAPGSLDYTFTSEPADPNGDLLFKELSNVKLTFTNVETLTVDPNVVSVSLDGEQLAKDKYNVSATGKDNIINVTFTPALTTEDKDATVSLSFPAGSISGKKGENADSNTKDLSLSYKLVPPVKYDLKLDIYKPAPNEEGQISAEKSFAMTFFSCDITDLKADRSSTEPNVTMKEVNGDYVCTAKLKIITGVTSDKSTFYAEFDQPVYNGEYEITIEKGAIGNKRWYSDRTIGRSNDTQTLRFTLIGGQDRVVTPHIDLSIEKVTTEIVGVKGIPSEDDIYWYANVVEKENYPGPQIWEMLVENFFKVGAETFGMDWVQIYQMTAKKGEYTWWLGGLDMSTDYVAYAFGLDNDGNLYMPVTTIEFRTPDPIVSDNTFNVEVLSVEDGTEDFTKKVNVKVTTTNDDPYAVVALDKYIANEYDLTPGSEDEHKYLRNVLKPLVKGKVYNGSQTVTLDNIKIDALMNIAVFGFEGEATTSVTQAEFSTVDDDLEAITLSAYDPTISDVSATVYSFDMQRPYILGVISKAKAEEIGGIQNVHEKVRIPIWEGEGLGYYPWQYFAVSDLQRKAIDDKLSKAIGTSALRWDTDYYVYAYLMDEGGYRTSSVYYQEFRTLKRNVTEQSFELKLNDIVSNAPISTETFTANMEIIPADKDAKYALYYGDSYDFEEYLNDNRLDDWLYSVFMQRKVRDLYSGNLDFGYSSVYPGKNYILYVTGFDEAPNSEPAWFLFTTDGIYKSSKSETGHVGKLNNETVSVYANGHNIVINGDFVSASAYTTDGRMASASEGNVCRVKQSGCYIVRILTANGIETRKVMIK